MSTQTPKGLLATKQPDLFFEDNAVGRLKKEIWEASDAQIDAWLKEYGFPSPGANGPSPVPTSRPPSATRWRPTGGRTTSSWSRWAAPRTTASTW